MGGSFLKLMTLQGDDMHPDKSTMDCLKLAQIQQKIQGDNNIPYFILFIQALTIVILLFSLAHLRSVLHSSNCSGAFRHEILTPDHWYKTTPIISQRAQK